MDIITILKNIFLISQYIARKLYHFFVIIKKKQISSYNYTVHSISMNEICLILPNLPKDRTEKRSIIASLITDFISLAYQGISSFMRGGT